MKAVVIGEPSGATMETIINVYPRHKALVDEYIARVRSLVSDRLVTWEIWQYSKPVQQPRNLLPKTLSYLKGL